MDFDNLILHPEVGVAILFPTMMEWNDIPWRELQCESVACSSSEDLTSALNQPEYSDQRRGV